ncbi:MAG: hypothetical protein IJR49_01425, partial [Treponema sp.]|nr:hypothetical protein [Treponema sp.]
DTPVEIIKGEVTNPINPPPGCRFAARCPYKTEACLGKDPMLTDVGKRSIISLKYAILFLGVLLICIRLFKHIK